MALAGRVVLFDHRTWVVLDEYEDGELLLELDSERGKRELVGRSHVEFL